MRRQKVEHQFVEFIPDQLEEGVVYVSITYATVVHRCCCGCGSEVVTPLAPNRWSITFDGESISLAPSIGNWSFACQSHYWIERNYVDWARRWSREEIEVGRSLDRSAFRQRTKTPDDPPKQESPKERQSMWKRIVAAIVRAP
jgi:hypothetical protein